MTNQQEQITPPPELRRQWLDNDHFPMVTGTHDLLSITRDRLNSVIDQAAQWGADQELEACCKWLDRNTGRWDLLAELRAVRTASPSLKEQARVELDRLVALIPTEGALAVAEPIRRALEALDD
jgi:hypothetical protein